MNPDGGLKSFGHPVGASGLRMLFECWLQLRGEAPEERRIGNDRPLALTHNLGGYPGEMVSFVSIVGREQGRADGSSRHVSIHGHDVSYRGGGSGPVVVLIHGMAGSSETWEPVLDELAEHCTVVAPDLLGHGDSDKPRGDYSLGAHASSIRDLLIALGHDRATIVGQSFGGGVAMQLAYQYPERCERLVLVASGGLGQEVALLLRALDAARAPSTCCRSRATGVCATPGPRSRVGWTASGSGRCPWSPRCGAASRRSATARRARRSRTRCGPSSTSTASG